MQLARIAVMAVGLISAASPARAEVFATVQSGDGARILFYTQTGPCVGQARLAEHVAVGGAKTPGCWLLTESTVLVSFFDGERGDVPVSHLKRATSL
jgi:hypothetical protein